MQSPTPEHPPPSHQENLHLSCHIGNAANQYGKSFDCDRQTEAYKVSYVFVNMLQIRLAVILQSKRLNGMKIVQSSCNYGTSQVMYKIVPQPP